MARSPRLLPLGCIFLCVVAWPVRADDVEQAAETFNTLFGADLARVRKTSDARDAAALAARLLETAGKTTGQPAFLTLLCEHAYRLGSGHPTGYAAAIRAMELLAGCVPEQAAEARERILAVRRKQFEASRGDERKVVGEALLDSLLALIQEKQKADAMAEAVALYREARTVAKVAGSERLAAIEAAAETLAQRIKIAARIADVKALLARDPANVGAREGLVRIYLVDLDDPAEAAKHLKGCEDKALLKYVPAAAKGVEAAPEFACLELGEWYRGLAEKAPKHAKAAMYARAKAYLERFLTLHMPKDLNRTRATVALEKVEEAVARLEAEASAKARPPKPAKPTETSGGIAGGVIRPGQWVDLLPLVDPEKDAVKGAWQRRGGALVNAQQPSCIALPVSPRGSYEIETTFQRTSGTDSVCVYLPVGSHEVLLLLSAWHGEVSGLAQVKSRGIKEGEAAVRPGTIENGRDYHLAVKVLVRGTEVQIIVSLNGTPYFRWRGPSAALSVPDYWAEAPLLPLRRVGLTVQRATVVWQNLRFRVLSGEARLLRTKQAAEESDQAATPAATPGLPIRPGQWVNLLKTPDPKRHCHEGECEHKPDGLWVFSKANGRLTVPVLAQGSYQAEFAWKRTWGPGQVSFTLPVGEGDVTLVLGGVAGAFSGLASINGKGAGKNETTVRPAKFEYKRVYHVGVQVKLSGDQAHIKVLLDGKPYISWGGPQSALSANYKVSRQGCFGLGLWGAGVLFSEGRLKMLSGEARLLRPAG